MARRVPQGKTSRRTVMGAPPTHVRDCMVDACPCASVKLAPEGDLAVLYKLWCVQVSGRACTSSAKPRRDHCSSQEPSSRRSQLMLQRIQRRHYRKATLGTPAVHTGMHATFKKYIHFVLPDASKAPTNADTPTAVRRPPLPPYLRAAQSRARFVPSTRRATAGASTWPRPLLAGQFAGPPRP